MTMYPEQWLSMSEGRTDEGRTDEGDTGERRRASDAAPRSAH